MTPDLYGAWLTAGNRLQPVGAWLASNWGWLVSAVAAAAFAAWTIRRSLRQASRTVDQILAEPPTRETTPGSDEDDLLTCLQILHATDTAPKGDPQP